MLSVNSKGKAVVLANGTVSCITQSNQAVKRALTTASHQGHTGVTVKDVALVEVGTKPLLLWPVISVIDGVREEYLSETRKGARDLVRYFKRVDIECHIERREYALVNSKKVS